VQLQRSDLMLLLRDPTAELRTEDGRPLFRPREPVSISPIHRPLEQHEPGEPWHPMVTNGILAWRYQGRLDTAHFAKALEVLVQRHGILRSIPTYRDGGWRFIPERAVAPCLSVLSSPEATDRSEEALLTLVSEFAHRPFRLDVESPLRAAVARVSADEHIVCIVVHHTFADAYSVRIISQEIAEIHHAFCRGGHPKLRELPFQYVDYMVCMEEWTAGPLAHAHVEFWKTYLHGAKSIAPRLSSTCAYTHLVLGEPFNTASRQLCLAERLNASVLWECLHQIAVHHLTGEHDVTTCSMDIGRRQKELIGLVGEFVNVIPFRSKISGDSTFRELLRTTRNTRVTKLSSYLATPCHLISEAYPFLRQTGTLNYIPEEFLTVPAFGLPAKLNPLRALDGNIRRPYFLVVTEAREAFSAFCVGKIEHPFTIAQLMSALERVAEWIPRNPDTPLWELPH
jgi:hypothetical protein